MEGFDLSKLSQILGQKLDAKTKFKLLDMIDERPVHTVDKIDPEVNFVNEEKLVQLCNDEIDYIIDDRMFSEHQDLLFKCRSEAESAAEQGSLKGAGYGRGEDYVKDTKVRGDVFIWLSNLSKDISQMKPNQHQEDIEKFLNLKELVHELGPLQQRFNEYLSEQERLDDKEIQLAMYGGKGEYYLRHKDAFRLDLNNLKENQKLRKITIIVYLNPELEKVKETKGNQLGELRVYLNDRIVDVVPHIGRVIMFKSERIEHEVKPTKGYQRFALTTWYHHTHRSNEKVITDHVYQSMDESIFIGIPSYRDPELPLTLESLIQNAEQRQNLRIGVCIQHDDQDEVDKQTYQSVQEIIEKYKEDGVAINLDVINFKDAKNAYYARNRVQKLCNNEMYYLQIDSHMRFIKNWDTYLKQCLRDCPNPQRSIITIYPRSYKKDQTDIPQQLQGPLVMCFKEFSKLDGLPRFSSKLIKKPERFTKPFKSLFWAAGFSFSFGKLITDCPYIDKIDDVFFGEEILQMQSFFNQGYDLYSPQNTVAYHLWERDYRKTYKEDNKDDEERKNNQIKCLEYIRESILNDEKFLQDLKLNRGVDMIGKTFSEFAETGGLDPSFV